MKVIKKGKLPDGTDIQIEDWKEDYEVYKTISIAAYPIAKNTSRYKWVSSGSRFRLGINRGWKSDEDVKNAFNDLIEGKKKLEGFADQFWNGNKDKWYLGMNVEYMGW